MMGGAIGSDVAHGDRMCDANIEQAFGQRICYPPESRGAEACAFPLGRVRIGPARGILRVRAGLIAFNTNISHLGDAQSAIEDDIGFVGNIAVKEERRDIRAVSRR